MIIVLFFAAQTALGCRTYDHHKKGLKARIIESHRPIKSLMDFKKKWESTKGCSNAEGLLSNIDELLKGNSENFPGNFSEKI